MEDIDYYAKVRDLLEEWIESGEDYSVIQSEVDDIVTNLQDFI
jgi:hypothetical protein